MPLYLSRRGMVEMDTTGLHVDGGAQSVPGDLGGWLEEVTRWRSGLTVAATKRTASDLVIEDRRARR